MRSFIFCTSYINGDPFYHSQKRYNRWIRYYLPLMEQLKAEQLFLIDDGGNGSSDFNVITGQLPPAITDIVNIYRFEKTLGRRSDIDFPGWWRSFLFSIEIASTYGYDKIIHIESDFFILSEKLKTYIRELNSGWTSLHSAHYEFPETAIQVICKDAFQAVAAFKKERVNSSYQMDNYAELLLPFTTINTSFVGDRLGEKDVIDAWLEKSPELLSRLDYIGQV